MSITLVTFSSEPLARAQPRRAMLRRLLPALLPTDVDFEAFCIDYFANVQCRFSNGMDRVGKVNLLLELAEPACILARLREHFGDVPDAACIIDKHLAERPTEEAQRVDDLREHLERLYLLREQARLQGLHTSTWDAEIIAVKRAQRQWPQLREGEVLDDRYRLIEVIGRGGFARVWQAFDRVTSRLVAVKILHGEQGDDQRRLARFIRGARQMKELHHPHIARVLNDPGEYHGFHYFVMDYQLGGDLHRAIVANQLERALALRTILQVGSALEYAHGRGLIHRDVKPQNILLNEQGAASLTDFDLVWVPDSTGGTGTNAMGTFLFSAPEEMEDASRVDQRADVYSLAMTTLFVLYRKSLPRKVLDQRALFIDGLECSEQIKGLLRSATAPDPEDRPATMARFCQELEGALLAAEHSASEPTRMLISTKPVSVPSAERESLWLPPRWPKWRSWGLLSVLGGMLLIGSYAFWHQDPAPTVDGGPSRFPQANPDASVQPSGQSSMDMAEAKQLSDSAQANRLFPSHPAPGGRPNTGIEMSRRKDRKSPKYSIHKKTESVND